MTHGNDKPFPCHLSGATRPEGLDVPSTEPTRLVLRPRDAAKALGISPRHLWQLTKDGHIPCVRLGNGKRQTILYPLAELRAWLSQQVQAGKGGAQ